MSYLPFGRTAFSPEAMQNGRAFTIIVETFPMRLFYEPERSRHWQQQTAEEVAVMAKEPRSKGAIDGNGVEMANQICRSGVVYQAKILEGDLYNDAIHFLQCCN
ncbi:hypothetical protein E4U36_003487 [Claviceps purpurea]|nr:hypothetical protein E4U37_000829 [Claviceps purpurea]KAG6182197.1 hypothetical protein E4U36_003487 [Claviceps purpurea]